jgi:regulator of protease activity HflC (stomatin/prohibitin superfamily)
VTGNDLARLFQAIYQRIHSRHEDPDIRKEELVEKVERIQEEIGKDEEANSKKIERWLRELANIAPDIFEFTVAALPNSLAGMATLVRKNADRAEHN